MVDMGEGLKAGVDVLMLGGGNPSHIPEVDRAFRQCMSGLLAKEGAFERAVGDYDPPQGNKGFIEAICELLRAECGWNIKPGNIALTAGSQSAFSYSSISSQASSKMAQKENFTSACPRIHRLLRRGFYLWVICGE